MGRNRRIDRGRLVELYRSGRTLKQAAAEAGCSHCAVWVALRDAGVQRRKPGPVPMGPADLERARGLRRAGLTYARIAAEMGCSLATMHRLLNPPLRISRLSQNALAHDPDITR